VIEAQNTLVHGHDGSTAIKRVTHFSDDFLAGLACERSAKAHLKAGEIDKVASVPSQVVDIWLRQGFSIYRESPKAIVARLQAEGLTAFITTDKAL
jgi:hypothetical protein